MISDKEKITALIGAIQQADKTLDWMLEPSAATVGRIASGRRPSEWAMATVKRVRRILRAALKKTGASTCTNVVGSAPAGASTCTNAVGSAPAGASTCTNAVGSAPPADEGKPSNDTVPGSARAQKGKKA